MAITAAAVNELRKKTGAGMMDCKKALGEVNGDMEKAVDFLRKKGMASAAKKAGRIAAEGLVSAEVSSDGKTATVLELNCETDFVAKNDDFTNFLSDLTSHITKTAPKNVDELLAQDFSKTPGNKVETVVATLIAKIGENIKVRRFERFALQGPGTVASYIHGGGQIGVVAELGAESEALSSNPTFTSLARDICLHIAAQKPAYLTEAEVPQSVLDKEVEIAKDQARLAGKKEEFLAKIAEGKVRKYYEENCLLNQGFVKDPNLKIQKLLDDSSKTLGGKITIRRFARFELGEGIEKKREDFAAEVAAQIGG